MRSPARHPALRRGLLSLALPLLAIAPALAAGSLPEGAPLTRLLVEKRGIARVTARELESAGSPVRTTDLSRLRLRRGGAEVPLLVETLPAGSPDGDFALSFLAEPPHGEKTFEHPWTRTAVYFLDEAPAEAATPPRISLSRGRTKREERASRSSAVTEHHERNLLLIRFTGVVDPPETWFWAQIRATDRAPTQIPVPADSVDPSGPGRIRVGLLGYSHLPENPDHEVEVRWNGQLLGRATWDGAIPFVFEAELPAGSVVDGENLLALHAEGNKTRGIDLVLLDWVELETSRLHRLGPAGQAEIVAGTGSPASIDGAASPLRAFDLSSPRAIDLVRAEPAGSPFVFAPETPRGAAVRWLLAPSATSTASVRIRTARPADLRREGLGADFLIVSHPSLLDASRRLAEARRREGLKTEVIVSDDVWDLFGEGFADPRALRDFVRFAWRTWRPRPAYLLLMGDSSWDLKNSNVTDESYADWHWDPAWPSAPPKNSSTPFHSKPNPDGSYPNDRKLIPTFQFQSYWGHAASDHPFSCMDDDDVADIAVGRIPAGTPEEADAAVSKILAYDALPSDSLATGVFITDAEAGSQIQVDRLAIAAERLGVHPVKIYPRPEEPDNAENAQRILAAWNRQPAIVIFEGHGGRYIWRTGPPDLKKNHDLFTLADLERLTPGAALPLVVSLTCYSAPFDHPVADSIGEKLVRMEGKGAIAVIASSWRNVPPTDFARRLIECLAEPGLRRLGDAFRNAMADERDLTSRKTYNLLGDPTCIYRGARPGEPVPPAASSKTKTKAKTRTLRPTETKENR